MPSIGLDPAIIASIAESLKGLAAEAGTACSMPCCENFTLGQHCSKCARRLCLKHTFYNPSNKVVSTYCIYCAVYLCQDAFEDIDLDEPEPDEVETPKARASASSGPTVIDADFEEVDPGESWSERRRRRRGKK